MFSHNTTVGSGPIINTETPVMVKITQPLKSCCQKPLPYTYPITDWQTHTHTHTHTHARTHTHTHMHAHTHLWRLRQHSHCHGAGVNPPRLLCLGYPLDPMHPRLELEMLVDIQSCDQCRGSAQATWMLRFKNSDQNRFKKSINCEENASNIPARTLQHHNTGA